MSVDQPLTSDEKEKVRQILASLTLPPEIERVEVQFADDSTGAPSMYLSFLVEPEAKLTKESLPRLSKFMSTVAYEFLQSGFPRFPYVSLDEAA